MSDGFAKQAYTQARTFTEETPGALAGKAGEMAEALVPGGSSMIRMCPAWLQGWVSLARKPAYNGSTTEPRRWVRQSRITRYSRFADVGHGDCSRRARLRSEKRQKAPSRRTCGRHRSGGAAAVQAMLRSASGSWVRDLCDRGRDRRINHRRHRGIG